jgi:AraC-like DNA-binding protein
VYQQDTATDFTRWRRLVSDSFVPLEAEPTRSGGFTGSLAGRHLRELAITRVSAGAHAVTRTPELISRGGTGYYKLSLQVSGHGLLVQDGRETVLHPGELAIYDTERPYTLSFDDDFSTFVLMFPRRLIGLPTDDVAQMTATTLGSDQGIGHVVAPFISRIGHMLPELDGPIGHRLAMNVVDLLATVMADELYSRPTESAHNPRLLRQAHQFIESQLGNEELTPAAVAAAQYISVRTLHQVFAGSGTTVARWIRDRRLEKCRRDLEDPLLADVPIGAVGARWGLTDPAHFSRLFRTAYGLSPAQYRRRSAQA